MKLSKPILDREEHYRVELYPTDKIRETEYVGMIESRKHVFAILGESERFLLLNDYWIAERDGVVTYQPICSEPVLSIPNLNFLREELKLELLDLLGEVAK